MRGRPDHTLATDIVAQSIGNLGIDIAVQSLGNLFVDIAGASVGTIPIDIAGQSIDSIAIDIVAQTISELNIDVTAQTIGNLQVDIAAASIAALKVDVFAQTIGNINIDISAQTVDRMYILPQAPTGATTTFKSGSVGAGTVVLHTVTTGKTFYLTYANLCLYARDVITTGKLAVRNVGNTIQYYLCQLQTRGGIIDAGGRSSQSVAMPIVINPALSIPAGWDIALIGAGSYVNATAGVGGWEE